MERPLNHLARGLASSTRHNALAYGYSLTISGAFGVIESLDHTPRVGDVFLFGLGAALTFTLASAGITKGFRVRREDEPQVVQAMGASVELVSVSGGIGAAALVGWAASGWIAWLVGPFAASSAYLFLAALELAVARRVSEEADLELEHADSG